MNYDEQLKQRSLPLYPEEAYTKQNNPSMMDVKEEERPTQKLLPLLIASLLGEKDNSSLISALISGSKESDEQLIKTLATTLTKPRQEKKSFTSTEKPFPKNETI